MSDALHPAIRSSCHSREELHNLSKRIISLSADGFIMWRHDYYIYIYIASGKSYGMGPCSSCPLSCQVDVMVQAGASSAI